MNKIVYNTYNNICIHNACIYIMYMVYTIYTCIQYLYSHIGTYILTCKIII